MTSQVTQTPFDLSQLRVIPIVKPGTNAFTFAAACTDEVEIDAQENALALGLAPGCATKIEPDPTISGLLDYIRARHR